MLNGVFGVKHPVNLARRDSSSKTRQNDTAITCVIFLIYKSVE